MKDEWWGTSYEILERRKMKAELTTNGKHSGGRLFITLP